MAIESLQQLSDRELLGATARAAGTERRSTAELLTLLGELDTRRPYLAEGCSSLFTYCTQVLHLSEHAAYHRIEAARAARQFPVLLGLLADGALTLTTVALLRPHLTTENHARVLEPARHKTKREVEHQVACLAPKPDQGTLVRKLAAPMLVEAPEPEAVDQPQIALPQKAVRTVVAPLAETRFLIKVTVSAETAALSKGLRVAAGKLAASSSTTSFRSRPAGRPTQPTSPCAVGRTTASKVSDNSGAGLARR